MTAMPLWKTARNTFVVTALLSLFLVGMPLQGFSLSFDLPRALTVTLVVTLLVSSATWLRRSAWFEQYGARWFRRDDQPALIVPLPRHLKRWALLAFVLLAMLPWFMGKYWTSVGITVGLYVMLAMGLNIVVGLAGLLDLGYVAFFAVGAYSYALGAAYWDMSFWLALPFGAALAALFGAVLAFPILRMHGDYLAIVTLGFGEIIRLVLTNATEITNGPNGIRAPAPTLGDWVFTRRAPDGYSAFHEVFNLSYTTLYRYWFLYLITLAFVFLTIGVVYRLKQMPIGRAWEAIREDEIAAKALGIYPVSTKLMAFSLGALFGGIAGVLFAAFQGFINPASFTFLESALILTMVVLGGMGSIPGVILAAVVLSLLPEVLREFSDVRMLVFGVLMIVMMIWRPRGLIRLRRRAFYRERPHE